MRKRNAVKKIAAVLASACLIVSMLATTVMAKPAITGTKGSLQINAKEGDKLDGYTFDLYKVADIRVIDLISHYFCVSCGRFCHICHI